MATQWKLTYRGQVSIGIIEPTTGEITFPGSDETVLLHLTFLRACEIASWSGRDQLKRINATLQKIEVFQGRDYRDHEFIGAEKCPYCNQVVSVIADDFKIHAIPACEEWKERNV